ncbi:hypothetical protein BKA64DRAFT_654126 [Cadophora sp. MPI-SDFR-AT-0126]|nr:hypothetical protein BKA64DRAFT_654126 [Leotiomycetes sp. MPI-SDFR-AT-0126]
MAAHCTQLDTFYDLCGHQTAVIITHIRTCPSWEPTTHSTSASVSLECSSQREIRCNYLQGSCPNCEIDFARGLPHPLGHLDRLRAEFRARVNEQNARDAARQAAEEIARRAQEEEEREIEERKEAWLHERERQRRNAEATGTSLENQPLVYRPDIPSCFLLHRVDGNDENCSICTESMGGSQDIRQLPCKHHFHMECITPWFDKRKMTCPISS